MNREIGLLNLMNTPEHCSAPFHSVNSKVAKSTKMAKMAAAHIQTYVLHVTWSILYTYLISIYIYIHTCVYIYIYIYVVYYVYIILLDILMSIICLSILVPIKHSQHQLLPWPEFP